MQPIDRRSFLAAGAAGLSALVTRPVSASRASPSHSLTPSPSPLNPPARPAIISSRNGMPAVNRAMEMLRGGADPIDAVVGGIAIVEDDPNDMTVGLGGLPNEQGVVELDASVMHGPSHKAGAVAGLQNIRHASAVALLVLRRTNHTLLVGDGAKRFALAHGFEEENLLTERSREAWLRWRANLSRKDDWLGDDERGDEDFIPFNNRSRSHADESPFGAPRREHRVPGDEADAANHSVLGTRHSYGTIHCAAVNADGDLGACTSTSGLSYKIPGRVGDSPIIGAGNFVDNLVGAAGATGRGESVIKSCGAFQIVQHMARGDEPTEACLKTLKWIADHTRRRRLRNERGEPNFQVAFYALRKDGAYGSACMRKGAEFVIHDGTQARSLPCAYLYE